MCARRVSGLTHEEAHRVGGSREALDAEYFTHFFRRNGTPDFAARLLPRRETTQRRRSLESEQLATTHSGIVTQREFDDARRSKRLEGSALLGWLVTLSKANESEAWGVDYLIRHKSARLSQAQLECSPRRLADLEETYHTGALEQIVAAFGLHYENGAPPIVIRWFIRGIARLPDRASYLLLCAGELVGTVAFDRMISDLDDMNLDEAVDGFAREILYDILADEISHVSYLMAALSRSERVALRGIVRFAALAIGIAYRSLDGDPLLADVETYSVADFPAEARRDAFVV